ncbi:hypothetical protein AVEN_206809-1 [Araneus ventricosus]|uniref:Uncharacterized protein n=1 Tax=Araneus ventricosus TaxID=182803 RepID=A0A4Y2C6W7_ARAVE|nr:hypothetical protein AVEN_206809-1 [Araneus ventricosus]
MPIRGFTSKVKVHDELIPVNPYTIFRRISILKKSDAELLKCSEFEVAPFPLSLFDEGGLLKTRKSVFYDLFSTANDVNFTSACYVADGNPALNDLQFAITEKGQGCTNSPENDNIITNLANQEAEIDIRMEEIISEVDLEEECQTLQVEKSDSKQTVINDRHNRLTFNI